MKPLSFGHFLRISLITAALASPALAQDGPRGFVPPPLPARLGLRANAELGFLAVGSHFIQLGRDGSRIDYRTDGEQRNLYTFARLSMDLDVDQRHLITLLYQPLSLDTQTSLRRDLLIDGQAFAAGTTVNVHYGFPFFRGSYAYDLLPARDQELAIGVSLQLRNADISFSSPDGARFRGRNDVGPVPLIKVRGRFPITRTGFFGFEIDGIYAPISVLNGSDNEVTGALLDASVRAGFRVHPHVEAFVNVRYLGGGAVGQGDPTPTSDGYQSNWLHFFTVSLGLTVDSRPTYHRVHW